MGCVVVLSCLLCLAGTIAELVMEPALDPAWYLNPSGPEFFHANKPSAASTFGKFFVLIAAFVSVTLIVSGLFNK